MQLDEESHILMQINTYLGFIGLQNASWDYIITSIFKHAINTLQGIPHVIVNFKLYQRHANN